MKLLKCIVESTKTWIDNLLDIVSIYGIYATYTVFIILRLGNLINLDYRNRIV
jgi:hypothetical protein